MRFLKYHGAGNDFVLLDCRQKRIGEKDELARRLCHRRFGIGADGCLFLEKSKKADVKMLIFNSDGSEANMCGNASRCVAKHLYEHKIVRRKEMKIETKAGIREISVRTVGGKVISARVDMGKPLFERRDIPARGNGFFIKETMEVCGKKLEVSSLNTGVPHAVVLVEDVEDVPIKSWGRGIRENPVFPQGANVNFLERLGKNAFRVRTYERGVEDETWACGTGIAASAVVAVVLGLADSKKSLRMQARGGTLTIEVEKNGEEVGKVYMSGPAKFVFEGEI